MSKKKSNHEKREQKKSATNRTEQRPLLSDLFSLICMMRGTTTQFLIIALLCPSHGNAADTKRDVDATPRSSNRQFCACDHALRTFLVGDDRDEWCTLELTRETSPERCIFADGTERPERSSIAACWLVSGRSPRQQRALMWESATRRCAPPAPITDLYGDLPVQRDALFERALLPMETDGSDVRDALRAFAQEVRVGRGPGHDSTGDRVVVGAQVLTSHYPLRTVQVMARENLWNPFETPPTQVEDHLPPVGTNATADLVRLFLFHVPLPASRLQQIVSVRFADLLLRLGAAYRVADVVFPVISIHPAGDGFFFTDKASRQDSRRDSVMYLGPDSRSLAAVVRRAAQGSSVLDVCAG